jgi:hypothetical protein
MEIKIGIVQTAKEIELEIEGDDIVALANTFDEAINSEAPVVWLTDTKGRKVGVPGAKVAYIEIAKSESEKKVGFAR